MQSKYRKEYWEFRTSKGVEKKAVCVIAGENNDWKLR
jgi:hypothetical protein